MALVQSIYSKIHLKNYLCGGGKKRKAVIFEEFSLVYFLKLLNTFDRIFRTGYTLQHNSDPKGSNRFQIWRNVPNFILIEQLNHV